MGSSCWGMLQHPHLHGARFGDGDRLPLMARAVLTILLAWEPVERETLGREISFVATACLEITSVLLLSSGALRPFAPPLLGLGAHTSCRDGLLAALWGFFFLPLPAERVPGGEGLPPVLC